MPSDL